MIFPTNALIRFDGKIFFVIAEGFTFRIFVVGCIVSDYISKPDALITINPFIPDSR